MQNIKNDLKPKLDQTGGSNPIYDIKDRIYKNTEALVKVLNGFVYNEDKFDIQDYKIAPTVLTAAEVHELIKE